ncbi:hypothetical protein BKA58DRAFT_439246 [Alternaria rosae]|uniref:uncharacterized protein n=1 Tax=Alternaria rosae TaxID=1187941 RepID=UPI001E8D730E|nr:uncharacterized protein BKA58DRAFT_439246 [Alternaria rosae]KAH6873175.1 hypothetical protein BKA58DRAFT_439246 [Alternaria rosae]
MAPSAPTHEYYVTLEVLPTAPHDVIKASYRRLARIHHPDKNIGCRLATAKTQLINAAWEVLSDEAKRSEYDRTRPQQKASSSSSRPGPPPAATPQSRYQPPPRPDTTAQDEARAQAESNKKRQEWLNYEKAQEEQIRQCQNILKPLEAEVDRLNSKIDENRKTLASDVPYAWNVFSFLSKRLSEQEKSEIRLASINAENAIRIKQIPLEKARKQLSQLNDEFARRKDLEDTRLAAEKTERARKERLAREKAEEARQREWARQQAERNKVAQEAAERWKQEQAKQARETAERDRKERAAREARWKAAQEAAGKFRREQAEAETARQEQRKRAVDAALAVVINSGGTRLKAITVVRIVPDRSISSQSNVPAAIL